MAIFNCLLPDSLNYSMPWKTASHHRLTGQSTDRPRKWFRGPGGVDSRQRTSSGFSRKPMPASRARTSVRYSAGKGSRFPSVTVAQAAQRGCAGRRPTGRHGDCRSDGPAGSGTQGEPARQGASLEGGDDHRAAIKNLGRFWDQQPKQRRLLKTEIVKQLVPVMGIRAACQHVGLSRTTYCRSQRPLVVPQKKRRRPNKGRLPAEERAQIHGIMNSERFRDMPPRQIWATLQDEGK